MKQCYLFARIVGFVTVLGLAATITLATEPGHYHEPGGALVLQLNDGQKWPTDEALRQGMVNIRNAITPDLPAIQRDKLDTKGYDQLAGKVKLRNGNGNNVHGLKSAIIPGKAELKSIGHDKRLFTNHLRHDGRMGVVCYPRGGDRRH